jgi:hypothetical protein
MYASDPSPSHVYDETETISQWYRYLDTAGHREAERHIASVFEGYGLNVTIQEYTVQRQDGSVRGANVLGQLEGIDPGKCMVIGGHYDANKRANHGAYDNAVGVATVIELARLFTEAKVPPFSIVFAAWDAEEGGGAGSRHFLENMFYDTDIVASINLDMFGLNYPVRNQIPTSTEEYYKLDIYTPPITDFSIYDRGDFNESTMENFTWLRDTIEYIAYDQYKNPRQWVVVMDDTVGASDHRVFIQNSIPTLWFRGMNEKPRDEGDLNELAFKHTPIDTVETMERYAGGKSELLKGIGNGLQIAYAMAIQMLDHYNTTASEDEGQTEDDAAQGNIENSGPLVVGVAILVLMMATMVWYGSRGRGRAER